MSHLLDDGEVDLAQRLPHHRTLPLLTALLLHLPCTGQSFESRLKIELAAGRFAQEACDDKSLAYARRFG
eukprot:COSAG04_NODE_12250_length_662_cov_1.094139_2_plen_70_part_00